MSDERQAGGHLVEIRNRFSGVLIGDGSTIREAAETWSLYLRHADLQDADLRYAALQCADLQYADLSCANLGCANLIGADLRYAALHDAYLRHANLRHAVFTDCIMNWGDHDLIAERLRQAAGNRVDRRMVAGLILVSRDWCWGQFFRLPLPLDLRDWALGEMRAWVRDGDDAPDVLAHPGEEVDGEDQD